jgi:hypothetical protein
MATGRELIYDIRELVNAYSDDSNLSDEHIFFMIKNTRNLLIKQQMSNLRKDVPREALQVISLPMDIDKQCFNEFDVIKSTIKIPATLDNTGRSDLHQAYVLGSRFIKNINIIDYNQLPFVGADKYAQAQLFLSVDHKNYLIGFNTEGRHLSLEEVEVEAVFQDPEEAYKLSCDYDPDVDFFDVEFPINGSLVSPLKNQVLQELLLKFKLPLDMQNNAEDDQKPAQQITN